MNNQSQSNYRKSMSQCSFADFSILLVKITEFSPTILTFNTCLAVINALYIYIRRAENKGTLEFGATLQEEWQQIPRAMIDAICPICPTGVMHVLLGVEVTPDIDLDSISFMCFR